MHFLLDVIIALIFIIFVIDGIKKGFIKSVCGVGITIVSILLAINFNAPLANYFRSTVVYENLTENLNQKIEAYVNETLDGENEGDMFEQIPAGLSAILSGFGTSTEDVAKEYRELITKGEENISVKIYDYIVKPAAQALSNVLAIIVIFVASIIILNIAVKLLDLIFKLPVLSFANKAGGFAVGAVLALLFSFVFCTVVNLALPYLSGIGININAESVSETVLFSKISEINPLSFIYR